MVKTILYQRPQSMVNRYRFPRVPSGRRGTSVGHLPFYFLLRAHFLSVCVCVPDSVGVPVSVSIRLVTSGERGKRVVGDRKRGKEQTMRGR